MTRTGPASVPLTSEQTRRFVVDGFLRLTPTVPAGLHETILARLNERVDDDDNPGNNVLPVVPEMRYILRSPEVLGALTSLLGPNYIEHPHRFCHIQARVEGSSAELAQRLVDHCHQDAYTPLARPRQHHVRYARVMYYPQDTPVERGPTHVIGGTQLNRGLDAEDRKHLLPVDGPAGTVSITHFDVGHAAGNNQMPDPRYMVKFIFMRAAAPAANGWAGEDHAWQAPEGGPTEPDLSPGALASSHLWDWLRGAPSRYASLDAGVVAENGWADRPNAEMAAAAGDESLSVAERVAAIEALGCRRAGAADAVDSLVALLNQRPEQVRSAATYALGAIGEPAVPALEAVLERCPELLENDGGVLQERAYHVDDAAHALAAVGAVAVPALVRLLSSTNPWARVAAAFALGEMDSAGEPALDSLLSTLEGDDHHVVRVASDALGTIGSPAAVGALGRLLTVDRPQWHEKLRAHWCAQDQVRVSAANALARIGAAAQGAEASLIAALDDPCGQVVTSAVDALRRIGSPTALDAAFGVLEAAWWDPTLPSPPRF